MLRVSRLTLLYYLLVALIPVALAGWWHTSPENGFLYDDAYISFRYSVNLANGHGLVWNPGGEPTQGYTNFLFVVLTAVGIKLGLSAVHAGHALNLIGLALISGSFLAMARLALSVNGTEQGKPVSLAFLPAIAAACAPITLVNALTGMETVLWAGLVFLAAALALAYLITPDTRLLTAHATVSFLGCLTRPESVLFAALWLAILWMGAKGQRRAVLVAGLLFGMAGLIYVAWLQVYFGAVLPNSFYVKVADTALMPGRPYVEDYLNTQVMALGWLLLPLVGLFALPWRRALAVIAVNAVVGALLIFYLFAFPLMGLYHRFVFPVSCALLGLSMLGLAAATEAAIRWLSRRVPASRLPDAMRLGMAVLTLALVFLPAYRVAGEGASQAMSAGELFYANRRMGQAIAALPEAPNILIAYNDVGILPFVSRAKNLDTVGLNDNTIARNAKQQGFLYVVAYVIDSHPDVIGFYTFPDGTVYNYGHGVIGGYYSVLASTPNFVSNYTFAGAFDAGWVRIPWFVYKQSPYYERILAALRAAADIKDMTIKP